MKITSKTHNWSLDLTSLRRAVHCFTNLLDSSSNQPCLSKSTLHWWQKQLRMETKTTSDVVDSPNSKCLEKFVGRVNFFFFPLPSVFFDRGCIVRCSPKYFCLPSMMLISHLLFVGLHPFTKWKFNFRGRKKKWELNCAATICLPSPTNRLSHHDAWRRGRELLVQTVWERKQPYMKVKKNKKMILMIRTRTPLKWKLQEGGSFFCTDLVVKKKLLYVTVIYVVNLRGLNAYELETFFVKICCTST